MRRVIRNGKKNTAMMAFQSLLSNEEIDAVVYFVRQAFMQKKIKNTRYHTKENGWLNHDKYKIAFPFATGEIALDTPDERLTKEQLAGKNLYLSSCVSCHDRAKVNRSGDIWESRPLSWPRNGYSHKQAQQIDATSQASPYAIHDIKNVYVPGSESELLGQIIFQNNCAFCHAPDGSGKHWIGQFVEPHPKNFASVKIRNIYNKQQLKKIIRSGKENTAMPAWRYVLSEKEIDAVVAFMWQRFN